MKEVLKRLAGKLPKPVHTELKRIHFGRQVARGSFRSPEPEFELLREWVRPGDWVLDVGANIGHYTVELARLVGSGGRVVALEPAALTFDLLASNVARAGTLNVTLLNLAASDRAARVSMHVPAFSSGSDNFYRASITKGRGRFEVLAAPLDSFPISGIVSFVKIDVEGHEAAVIAGMRTLIARDRPRILVEDNDPVVPGMLRNLGYVDRALSGSPNRIFERAPAASDGTAT